MSIWIALGIAYLAVGTGHVFVGPLARLRRRESLVFAMTHADLPRWKLAAFDLLACLTTVALWTVFLLNEARPRAVRETPASDKLREELRGLKFQHLGGAGRLACGDCGFSQQIRSHTHGFDGSHTSGHQCQSCGAMHEVHYEPAFRQGTPESDALHSRLMIDTIEGQMQKTPRREWLKCWEPDLAQHRRRLEGLDIDGIVRKQTEANAAFEAKLVCRCGGRLSRDEVLTCPSCRGRNLSYQIDYTT
jgi:hypothetical protein